MLFWKSGKHSDNTEARPEMLDSKQSHNLSNEDKHD